MGFVFEKRHCDCHRRRAFTLTEVMVVVIILMIGIIPIYDSMVTGAKRTRFNRRRNFAASICNNAVEIFKKMNIKTLVEKKDDDKLKKLVMHNPGAPSTCYNIVLCPWLNPQVKEYMELDSTIFKQLVNEYEVEFRAFQVLGKVTESDIAALKNKLINFQVQVSYKDLDNESKELKRLAAAMILTDPCMPAGKLVPQTP
jgi:prepilin-type N-terminal cleavage/methylation domain-containing protein